MATIPANKTAGEELAATEVNKLRDIGYVVDLDAGETINGATLPVAVYIDDDTNEVYACDGDDQDKLEFIGFAISNSTDGNAIQIQVSGIVAGFTGLDIGKKYYVQDDKTIGTAIGTYETIVGIAISATQILIMESPGMQYVGSVALSVTGDVNLKTGVCDVPKNARIIILDASYTNSGHDGNIILFKIGKTTVVASHYKATIGTSMTCTYANDVLTCTSAETVGGDDAALSGTVYFYR